jgi:hypothetical protein
MFGPAPLSRTRIKLCPKFGTGRRRETAKAVEGGWRTGTGSRPLRRPLGRTERPRAERRPADRSFRAVIWARHGTTALRDQRCIEGRFAPMEFEYVEYQYPGDMANAGQRISSLLTDSGYQSLRRDTAELVRRYLPGVAESAANGRPAQAYTVDALIPPADSAARILLCEQRRFRALQNARRRRRGPRARTVTERRAPRLHRREVGTRYGNGAERRERAHAPVPAGVAACSRA